MISVKINYGPSIINHFAVLYLLLSLSFCFFQLSFFLFGFFSLFKAPSSSCHHHTIHFTAAEQNINALPQGSSKLSACCVRKR